VATICAGFEGSLVHPEPALRRTALNGIKRLLDVAEDVGANGLIIAADYGTPPLPNLEPAIDMAVVLHDLLLAGLREIGEHLRGMHTALLLEPLNRYESRALRRMAPAVHLCEESGSPNVKVMYDLFHMSIEEADPIAALRDAGARLGHVHLADSNRQLPGYGHTDVGAFMQALDEMGYTGAAALECGVPGDPDTLLPACVRLLRRAAEGHGSHDA
jgi:sugar phosphate isomerase/epimerase